MVRGVMLKLSQVLPIILLSSLLILSPASAAQTQQQDLLSDSAIKILAAAVAFGLAVLAAGFTIAKAGSAGLAAAAERPEVRTTAIIIAAFGEALAIYGIVVAFFILGAG